MKIHTLTDGMPIWRPIPNYKGGGFLWQDKGYYEIVADINTAVAQVKSQCEGKFQPDKDKFKILIDDGCMPFLKMTNEYGFSIEKYINACWPNCEIVGHCEPMGNERALMVRYDGIELPYGIARYAGI